MKAKLVKFDNDGTKCKNDINYLRRHPECGISFIQDKPFRPVNPNHKFKPIDRNFTIDNLDREVPSDPNIPDAPPIGQPQKIGGAVGSPPYTNKLLSQDYSNYQQGARRLVAEVTEQERSGGYSRLPSNDEPEFTIARIGNSTYSHETPEPPEPRRAIGDIELQNFGAGTGNTFQDPQPINQSGLRSIDAIQYGNVEIDEVTDTVADTVTDTVADTVAERTINITDLPDVIKDYIISTQGRVANEIDVDVLARDLAELEELIEGYEEDRQMVRDEMIRNVNEGNALLADENIRFLGRHTANKTDRDRLKNKLEETKKQLAQRKALNPTRRPMPESIEIELTEFERQINLTDLDDDLKRIILDEVNTTTTPEKTRLTRIKETLDRQINALSDKIGNTRRSGEATRLRASKMAKISTLRGIQSKIDVILRKESLLERTILRGKPDTARTMPAPDPRELEEFTDAVRPRGVTQEEITTAQVQQLTRNSTTEEARTIEASIRKGKGKGKAKATPTPREQEMFPIEPDREELVFLKEVEKILTPGETDLTTRQKANLSRELRSRGISQERIESLLLTFEYYDPALESAAAGSSRPREEEALMRRLRTGIREIPIRDSNFLPERQPSVEVREDTPLASGRTDIARGRGRVEKVYDRVSGKLPEELRTLSGSVKRNAEAFNENVRTRSLEAIQGIQSTTTRVFGQRYEGIRETATELRGGDIELVAPEGNINIRPPATEDVTGIRQGDLEALDFDPLGTEYGEQFIPGARPKLSYAERLNKVRTGAVSREAGVGSVGAVGGVLIGFGVAELMGKAGVTNKYAIAAGAGGGGGAGARILTMAGSRALTQGAETAATDAATYAAVRGGTSILRGAAEGAVIGLALLPVDMLLNDHFVNSGKSHVVANLASGGIVGGTATALTTIGLASLGAAPETLGASLVVGGVAIAATSVIGFFTGKEQDRKEKEIRKAKRARDELNSTSTARQSLLATLPNYDYNFDRALNAYADKDSLGIDDNTWNTFSSNTGSMFVAKPSNTPPPTPTSADAPTGEQKRINDLFGQYITHELIGRVCTDGDCEELKTHDQGALTPSEVKFLNDKTGSTWQGQANMQVEMSVQELQYTRERIGAAQLEMLTAWNDQKRIANQLDPYVVETASLDPTFRQRYDLAVKLDAQQQVVDAYQTNQTRFEELPKNIRDMANLDPDFDNMIHQYYNSMETTAGQLSVSVPQLIELQSLEGEAQKDKYQEFQFDDIKRDPVVVEEAKEIASEEDQVREAGFYDIDQAFLETDPTAISTWHPSDSQILQAHSAGMNLNEYVEYMHQLSMGEVGDYTKLPKYSDDQLRASGLLDYSHFQDELQMANYRKDLYLYDPETRQFTLNPNITNSGIPSTQESFISRYTPRYLLQARQQYGDMIHGLNAKNQNEVDNYNNNLMRELTSYGKNYDSIVANINNERLYEGRSDLLYYDVGKIYDLNKIEFNALSDKLKDAPTNAVSQDVATGRQLGEQSRTEKKKMAAEKTGLSVSQYDDMKRDIASKGIKDPTQEQINQAVVDVKISPVDAPPMAS